MSTTNPIFEAIADRLGEHPRSFNVEIADSGEYNTSIPAMDVENLAEWLMPAVLAVEAKARAEVIDWIAKWEVFSPATIRLARDHFGVDTSIRSDSEEDRA